MPRNHLINRLHPVAAVYNRRRVLTKHEDSAVTNRRYNLSGDIYAMASRTKAIIGHPERSRGRAFHPVALRKGNFHGIPRLRSG
jgi:hypothetical protein